MRSFDTYSVPRIIVGRGSSGRLGELAAGFGGRCALVYNGSLPDAVTKSLDRAGIAVTSIRQKGEPTVDQIDSAVVAARAAGADMVIAVGGGSAIDAGKAVAGLLTNPGNALDYLEVVGKGQKITKAGLPFIAVPTTAGTGAEATRNAVLGVPEKKFKASLRSELLLPRVAVVDAELGAGVPREVIASSGMDALCQCIEAYTSNGANAMSDAVALDGVVRAARSLRRAYENPSDMEAREDMALAALLSGIALTNAGLGAVHGFAAPLGAAFPVPHGVVCAALLPHVLRANISAFVNADREDDRVMMKYLKIGEIFLGKEAQYDMKWEAVYEFPKSLAKDFAVPRLSAFGMTAADIPGIVALAQKASSMKFNPVVLPAESLGGILQSAI